MSGMLNMSAVDVARARAGQAAARRRRDEELARMVGDKQALIEDHRRNLAAATGLHKVMLAWHEPTAVQRCGGLVELICDHCSDNDCCCGRDVEWPCGTYKAVLANP